MRTVFSQDVKLSPVFIAELASFSAKAVAGDSMWVHNCTVEVDGKLYTIQASHECLTVHATGKTRETWNGTIEFWSNLGCPESPQEEVVPEPEAAEEPEPQGLAEPEAAPEAEPAPVAEDHSEPTEAQKAE